MTLPPMFAATVVCAAWAGPAFGECGLEQCPVPLESPGVGGAAVARATGFDLDGTAGDYALYSVRVDWDATPALSLSAVTSYAVVRTDDGEGRGTRNPVFLGELRALRSANQRVLAGLQWEAPWGDETVSTPHSELVTYVRYQWSVPGLDLVGGYRFSTSEDGASPSAAPASPVLRHAGHSHGSTDFAPFVNPHEAREVLWRAEVVPLRRLGLNVQGAHPLTGETEGEHFVTTGVSAEIPVVQRVAIVPSFSAPVSESRRYDWTAGLEVAIR